MLDERPIGGLGVHLVRTLMDDLHYERINGRNHIKMVTKKGVILRGILSARAVNVF